MASSKGLGRAVAQELAREGAHVVISSSNKERCALAAREIAKTAAGSCHGCEADMFNPAAVEPLIEEASRLIGPIDILVINHLGPALGLAHAVDFDVLTSHYRLMVETPLRLIAAVLPGMRKRRWGRILSVAGASIINALPNKVMDNLYRPALVNYTKALAAEVSGEGVTANIILPGTFMTDRVRDSTDKNAKLWGISVDEAMRGRLEAIPAGRFGELEEFGALAAFICSQRAGYITGTIMRIDGGQIKSML
jgi:3-oxoacyl-[acyl-carrier protein] reductase